MLIYLVDILTPQHLDKAGTTEHLTFEIPIANTKMAYHHNRNLIGTLLAKNKLFHPIPNKNQTLAKGNSVYNS